MKEINFYLNRTLLQPERTFGEMLLEDKHFCWTLEDTDRGLHSGMSPDEIKQFKIPGKTAIPAGRYKLVLAFSNRFQRMMPYLIGTTGFTGVLLHGGNDETDTEGCPLCAYNKDEKAGRIQGSAEKEVIKILKKAQTDDAPAYITIN